VLLGEMQRAVGLKTLGTKTDNAFCFKYFHFFIATYAHFMYFA